MNRAVYKADLDDFVATLERNQTDITTRVIDQIIHQTGEDIGDKAREYAPRDTGELIQGIEVINEPGQTRVVSTAPHSAFVEFGTWSHNIINPKPGTYTIRPRKAGGVLRFTTKTGDVVYTKKVEHPGIEAQQFMRRANEDVLDDAIAKVANVGVQLVVGT